MKLSSLKFNTKKTVSLQDKLLFFNYSGALGDNFAVSKIARDKLLTEIIVFQLKFEFD